MSILDAARERLGVALGDDKLILRRIRETDIAQILDKEARAGAIGHCSICFKPYPNEPRTKKIVCPDCVEKQHVETHPIMSWAENVAKATGAAVKALVSPTADEPGTKPIREQVGSGTRPEVIGLFTTKAKPRRK